MSPRPKHTSRSRRRSRRADQRDAVVASVDLDERISVIDPDFSARLNAIVAAATGSTSLPLSDQGDAWDAGAAAKGLTPAQLPNAYFWVDPDGDEKTKAAYKLGFAENRDGTLTAVWRGVTAAAGAIQGARGGVDIPSADVAAVKAKIGAYYTKAAKKYGDKDIKPPWAAAEGQSAAFLLAYAECAALSGLDRMYAEVDGEEILIGVGGSGEGMDQWLAVLAYWEAELAPSQERAALDSVREALGGAPSKGTDADRRLKKNRMETLAKMGPCAECDHAFDMHESDDGACTMEGCSCDGYVTAEAAAVQDDAQTFALVNENGVAVGRFVTHLDGDCVRLRVEPLEGQESIDETIERLRAHLQDFTIVDVPVAEELPAPNGPQPVVTPPPDGGAPGELRWVANLVPEATLTDDGRAMAPGALTWRELPLTLMAMVETSEGGHVGAEVAGRIDEIYRDGNMIKGSGVFAQTEYGSLIASLAVGEPVDPELLARVQNVLLVDEEGALVASLVADQTLRGISVDLAIHQYEVGPKSDYFDEDGNWLTEKPEQDDDDEPPSLIDLLFGDDAAESIFVVTEAVIGAVTVCPFQAFADANIALAAGGSPAVWTVTQQGGFTVTRHEAALTAAAEEDETIEDALTASAVEVGLAPLAPPAAWFDNPEFEELTPLTIDEDGRIYGHAAAWDTCHLGIPGVCTTAPQTETNYAYFLLKEVLCEDGERVPCGTITLETGHADKSMGRSDATAHYDNTGLAAADVNVGEDEYGIWVAGAIRPHLSAEKARELRGAVLSGDWRSVNGNLELVALLAVNVPGFPVPRARALVASGEDGEAEVLALVAAGITIGDVSHALTGGDDEKPLTALQVEKIKAHAAIASGRLAALRARAAGGVVTKKELRSAAGFDTEVEEPEAPAEEPEAVE